MSTIRVTLAEARKVAARLKLSGSQGGIGIVAGSGLRDPVDPALVYYLGYMDLDNCRNRETGELTVAWAQETVEKFNSYTEVSPSGIGLKIFFLYQVATNDATAKEKVEGEKKYRGYELRFRPTQYSTVTGIQFENYDQLKVVGPEVFTWVEEVLRPRIDKTAGKAEAVDEVTGDADATSSDIHMMLAKVKAALAVLSPEDNQVWINYGYAMKVEFQGTQLEDAARDVWIDWLRQKDPDKYEHRNGEMDLKDRWNGLKPNSRIKVESIYYAANETKKPWDKGLKGKRKRDGKQDTLLSIIEGIELFHDDDGNAFADLMIDGHRETWSLRSTYFKRWLQGEFYERTGSAVDDKTETLVIKVAEAKARKGLERKVYLRIANAGNTIYHDRGDKHWSVTKITADGWEVVDAPEVRFTRMKQMRALPEPVRGGSVDELRPLLNVDDTGFLLTKGWLLGALRGLAPYAIMGIVGEHGTAKSTYSRLLRYLIDPCEPPLRSMPDRTDDLYIAAFRSPVVTLNNVSYIDQKMSDALCHIAVDGGMGKRMLYTDDEEVILKDRRPVIINSITNVYTKGDLLDRSIILTLDYIPDDKRREEAEINKDFEKVQGRVLGALYDLLSAGLKRLADTKLAEKPRMADFAKWVVACLGDEAEPFMAAYIANRDDAQHELLEGDVVANAVTDLACNPPQHPFRHNEKQTKYRNLTALLRELSMRVEKDVQYSKSWPRTAKSLDDKLKRLAPSLRKDGVIFIKHDKSNGERAVELYSINTDVKSKTNLGSEPPLLADDYGDAIPENQHAPASGRRDDPNDPNTPM